MWAKNCSVSSDFVVRKVLWLWFHSFLAILLCFPFPVVPSVENRHIVYILDILNVKTGLHAKFLEDVLTNKDIKSYTRDFLYDCSCNTKAQIAVDLVCTGFVVIEIVFSIVLSSRQKDFRNIWWGTVGVRVCKELVVVIIVAMNAPSVIQKHVQSDWNIWLLRIADLLTQICADILI